MTIELDHIILAVNNRAKSIAFYAAMLGFRHDGDREPFAMLRVSESFVIQLAGWGTQGGEHRAFALSKAEFDDAFARIKAAGIPYGDAFHTVGNMQGPGDEAASGEWAGRSISSIPISTRSRYATTKWREDRRPLSMIYIV